MTRAESRRMAIIRLVCGILFLCLGLIAPTATLAAQVDQATPIVDVPALPGDEPAVTANDDGDVSAAAINAAYFDSTTYYLAFMSSTSATLIIKMAGVTTAGTYTISPPAFAYALAYLSATPSGPGVTCTGGDSAPPIAQITGTFTNTNIGPASCLITFTITNTGASSPSQVFADVDWGSGSMTVTPATIEITFSPQATAQFDQPMYAATVGDSITVSLTIDVPGNSTVPSMSGIGLTPILPYVTISNVSGTPGGGGTALSCVAAFESGSNSIVVRMAYGALPFTCTVSFTLTLNSWPGDGVSFPLVTLITPPQGAGDTIDPSTTITGYFASSHNLDLDFSNASPAPGEIVTVTATQTYSGSGTANLPASLQVSLPAGVTLYSGTQLNCNPGCSSPATTPSSTSVLATYTNGAGSDFTVSLIFDVKIDEGVDSGTTLTFDADGESGTGTISAFRTGPTSASLTVAEPLVTSDLDLDVAYAGTVDGTIAASGGTPDYSFTVQDQPGMGDVDLDPATGHFTYTAHDLQTGLDTFTVLVTDARTPTPQTALATVQVTIAEPAALMTTPLTITGNPGETTSGNLGSQVTGGMPPYDFSLFSQASQGVATVNPDGSFTFSANGDATGGDSFSYSVKDGELVPGAAAVVTGDVTITYAALPPDATSTATATAAATITATVPATPPASATATATETGGEPSTATPPPSPSATVDSGVPPARPTSTATPTPTGVSGGSAGTGVTTLPSTGTGGNHDGSMLLMMLTGSLMLLAAGMGVVKKRRI